MERNIKIVPYQSALREEIVNFIKSIAIDEFGFKEWKDYLENKDFSSYENGESIFIIVKNESDEIIATCGGLKVDSETIKLNSLYVEKSYRGQHIGSILYQKVEEFAKEKGFKYIILCTYEKFDMAKDFYKKRGFKLYKIEEEIELWCKKEI